MANSKWFQAFQTMNWQNAPAGKKPSEYQFHGNAVSIDVQDDREAEQVIKLFEPWIPRTSEQYRSDREQEQRVALEQMRHVLRKQTEDAERERKILDAIRRAAQPK